MSILTDGFIKDPNTTVEWLHYNKDKQPTGRFQPIPKDSTGTEAPIIGDEEGYLTLRALNKAGEKVMSKLKLKPPFLQWGIHRIVLSYNDCEWTVKATTKSEEKGKGLLKNILYCIKKKIGTTQIHVNIEIGP